MQRPERRLPYHIASILMKAQYQVASRELVKEEPIGTLGTWRRQVSALNMLS
jgi:hypothetical protein